MKNTYTEKPICLCSDLASRMTCLRYYSYLCFLVVQENQNMYLKKVTDLSYRILVQGSVFFLRSLTHLKAKHGVAFLMVLLILRKKTQNFEHCSYFTVIVEKYLIVLLTLHLHWKKLTF